MKRMRVVFIIIPLFFFFIFCISPATSTGLNAEPLPTADNQQAVTTEIEQAILDDIAGNEKYVQAKMVTNLEVTDIITSLDQLWATAWVVYYDAQIGSAIPSEPALAVTHFVDDEWQVYLPSENGWEDMVYSTPEDLLSKGEKDMWVAMNQGTVESYPTQSGYLLPWHGGQTAYLSRSVGHDADFSTAHFAFDFYVPGNTVCPSGSQGVNSGLTGLNFDLYAAKAGTVWGWEDSVTNCDHSNVNFLVLRNIDNPDIFQLYMHLSQDSIPAELKTVGATVSRGQFIGVVDNTGNSTGSHLHFQVEHQPYWPSNNPYWSTALDMTFDDVDINGGRPRVSPLDPPYCTDTDICDVFRFTYISGNYFQGDSTPPTGDLSGVDTGQIIKVGSLTISGWGSDDQSGLDHGQLIANFDGGWFNLGPQFNPNISYSWNLCDPALPVADGPVSVALVLYDLAGNISPMVGLRHFTKSYTCPNPPPSCVPDQDQVTLFEDPFFNGGCVKYSVGNYPSGDSLNPLGNNDGESILVGNNVIATLFSEESYKGHSQAITHDIGYWQYQWITPDTLSSLRVSSKGNQPLSPTLNSPLDSAIFRQGDIIPLSWSNGGGAIDYRIEIYLNSNLFRSYFWHAYPYIYVDSLGQGTYTWRVQGRNSAGGGPWSGSFTFTIASSIMNPPEVTVPYSDTMETSQFDWVNTEGWRYESDSQMAHSGIHSWWYQNIYGNYNNGLPNYGFLTSPRISITEAGYYLRFYYRYQTETQGTTWDQRWVQISVDDGPFINMFQLSDDPQMLETSSWLQIKPFNLSDYAGHIIRFRFQFFTLDSVANNFSGWGIDDFSITQIPPSSCGENREDDTPEQAFVITYDQNLFIPGEICPNGDFDFYKFFGTSGDQIVVDINAMSDGSLLDAYLFLVDSDGNTVIAENDDEVYAQKRDPLLSYTLLKDGLYYLKLRAWKNPLVGGDKYFYNMRLYKDNISPSLSLVWPTSGMYLPDEVMTISADISEAFNNINRVEFFWHGTNWSSYEWEYLGEDRDGMDGWSLSFDPVGEQEGTDAAFFIQAYDLAGNWAGAAAWSLGVDKTAPTTNMKLLSPNQSSNAFIVEWTSSDNLSGIDYVEIQQQINSGNWTTFPPIDGTDPKYWIIGIPGKVYSFRMHGIDHSGNVETYPTSAETSTAIPVENVLCFAPDSYDISGNDNSPSKASMIYADGPGQVHNYCNPLSPNYQNDEDWIKLDVTADVHYLVESLANSLPTATIISLYAQDGVTLLLETSPQEFGDNTALAWTSDYDGWVYIRIRHLDGRVIGNDVSTTVSVRTGEWTLLPIVFYK